MWSLEQSARMGLASVRANVVPMVVLWAVAVVMVGAYFHVPQFVV